MLVKGVFCLFVCCLSTDKRFSYSGTLYESAKTTKSGSVIFPMTAFLKWPNCAGKPQPWQH